MERDHTTPKDVLVPEPLTVHFETIPERLRRHNQWVVWRYTVVDDEVKKPPFSPRTGRAASVGRPDTWGSFAEAQKAYDTGRFAGIGIVLTGDMGIVGVDIDHCITEEKPSNGAQRIVSALDSYSEVSPSGTGIRIMLEGKLPGAYRRKGNTEMYEDMRYLTLTGHQLPSTSQDIQPRHRELYGLYQRLFARDTRQQRQENTGGGEQHYATVYHVARTDEAVLHKALAAKNADNFKRYYHGDTSLWEGESARHRSQSEADFTLVLMLLYWTNGDAAQVDRLFRQSGLMREKWTRPVKGSETYGDRLIRDAISKGRH